MDAQTQHQLRVRIDDLADDVGRLRRRLEPESSAAHLGDRIACHVHAIAGYVHPTAGELAASYAPGQDDAVTEAIRIVDARYRSLCHRLRPHNGNGTAA